MLSLAASSSLPVGAGVLGAVPVVGAIADMALMAFGGNFNAQMAAYDKALKAMTPEQVRAQSAILQEQRLTDARLAARAVGSKFASPLLRTAGGNVSFLSGIGKVFGVVSPVISEISKVIHSPATEAAKAATTAVDAAKTVTRTVAAHPVLAAAGAAAAAGGIMAGTAMGGKKLHPAVRKALGLHHHRRMHVTNTRALHRALRRIKGFERVARHVVSITRPGAHKIRFKFHRKRRAA